MNACRRLCLGELSGVVTKSVAEEGLGIEHVVCVPNLSFTLSWLDTSRLAKAKKRTCVCPGLVSFNSVGIGIVCKWFVSTFLKKQCATNATHQVNDPTNMQ